MMEELKPCPFCGGGGELIDNRVEFFARCDSCNVVVYGDSVRHLDYLDDDNAAQKEFDKVDFGLLRKSAIQKWNTRPSPWISVDDELPENEDYVLAFIKHVNGDFIEAAYLSIQFGWTYHDGYAVEVTHWMPLPEPPEEK